MIEPQGPASPARRMAALASVVMGASTLALAVVLAAGDVARLIAAPLLLAVTVSASWVAATRRGSARAFGAAVAVVAVVVTVLAVVRAQGHGLGLVAIGLLVAASGATARYALGTAGTDDRRLQDHGSRVGPARRGVLIMNLKSGGGKAQRFELIARCGERGIRPVVLQPGDDLLELARDAISDGADVIGMAGGDGSQALVASVAAAEDVPMVCIPAGTRNHFALDLGLDREDVVGALDAFADAQERRIDLASVSGRVFVNNVSLGVYAKIVQSPEYRDAKRQTTAAVLPDLLGPDAEPFGLRFVASDGTERTGAQIIQVSNNAYRLTSLRGFGTRSELDAGCLGIAAAEIHTATEAAAFAAAEAAGRLDRFAGWMQWQAPTFTVDASGPVEAGVDGEALLLDPPLDFEVHPGALRVRIPLHAPGPPSGPVRKLPLRWTFRALVRTALGRAVPAMPADVAG